MPSVEISLAPTNIEATSDMIDAVNVLRAKNTDPATSKNLYDDSEFDKAKDKTTFRQFNDACGRVKNFYAQQHTLQTVA
ncbi:hypothetical protein ACMYSQ_006200 [Aspergillus niger]